MKTLCVAVVVLSLISVCQPAPLTCEKLLKPVDKELEVTGTWYMIAVATESCLATTIMNALFELSGKIHINATDAPKVYSLEYNIKLYQYCKTDTGNFFYEKSAMFGVDVNNAPYGDADLVLQSGCPDCMVLLGDSVLNTTILFSRRKTVTAAELKEFEAQVECLGWSKPWVLQTDHDYKNCMSLDEVEEISDDLPDKMLKRLQTNYKMPLMCLASDVLQYPKSILDWLAELW
ncbi:hypothetical protein D5F01_LYC02793 [Larimichthys crocea]|uniref:Apolipoprotein M n=1 Tax=Larimichthys crocea TaxID=215358 RepID=A0A6G0J3F0_LARCR|nr:hypothetical protein D5F01_LYC02793 [Larimichthys crocea]